MQNQHQPNSKSSILAINSPIVLTEHIHDVPGLTSCDIIGDVHGCFDELCELLVLLGHSDLLTPNLEPVREGEQPRMLFVGDIVDRGDRVIDALKLVMELCEKGYACTTLGNHDYRFFRWLQGQDVKIAHGLDKTIDEFNQLPNSEREELRVKFLRFFEKIPYAIRFDGGQGVVVHAAWRPRMKEESDVRKIRYYAIYGPTTGERTSEGFPVRIDWAKRYKGPEVAIFGHQVYLSPYINPFAIGIDTGCVFGGALTALRYPSKEIVSIKSSWARAEYNGPLINPNDD